MPPLKLQSRIGTRVKRNSDGTFGNRTWTRQQNEESPISKRAQYQKKKRYPGPDDTIKSEPTEADLWGEDIINQIDMGHSIPLDAPALLSRIGVKPSPGTKLKKRKTSLIDRIGDKPSEPLGTNAQDTHGKHEPHKASLIASEGSLAGKVSPKKRWRHASDGQNTSIFQPPRDVAEHSAASASQSAHRNIHDLSLVGSSSTLPDSLSDSPASLARCKELLSSLVELNLRKRQNEVVALAFDEQWSRDLITKDQCRSFLSHNKAVYSEMQGRSPSEIESGIYHVGMVNSKQSHRPDSRFDMKYRYVPESMGPWSSNPKSDVDKRSAEPQRFINDQEDRKKAPSRQDGSGPSVNEILPTPPASVRPQLLGLKEPPSAPWAMKGHFRSLTPPGRAPHLSSPSKDMGDTGLGGSREHKEQPQMAYHTPPLPAVRRLSQSAAMAPVPPASPSKSTPIPIPFDATLLQQSSRDSKGVPRNSCPIHSTMSPRQREFSPIRRRGLSPRRISPSPTRFERSRAHRIYRSPSPLLSPRQSFRRCTQDVAPNRSRRSQSPIRHRSPPPASGNRFSIRADFVRKGRSTERYRPPRSSRSPVGRDIAGSDTSRVGARWRSPVRSFEKRRPRSRSPPPRTTTRVPLSPVRRDYGNRNGSPQRSPQREFVRSKRGSFGQRDRVERQEDKVEGVKNDVAVPPSSPSRGQGVLTLEGKAGAQPVVPNVPAPSFAKVEEEPVSMDVDADDADDDVYMEVEMEQDRSSLKNSSDVELYDLLGMLQPPNLTSGLDKGRANHQDEIPKEEKLPTPPGSSPLQMEPKLVWALRERSAASFSTADPPATMSDEKSIDDHIDTIASSGAGDLASMQEGVPPSMPENVMVQDIQEPVATRQSTMIARHDFRHPSRPGTEEAGERPTEMQQEIYKDPSEDDPTELVGEHRDGDLDETRQQGSDLQIAKREGTELFQSPPRSPVDSSSRPPTPKEFHVNLDQQQQQHNINFADAASAIGSSGILSDLSLGSAQCLSVPGRWFAVTGSHQTTIIDIPFVVDKLITSKWYFANNPYIKMEHSSLLHTTRNSAADTALPSPGSPVPAAHNNFNQGDIRHAESPEISPLQDTPMNEIYVTLRCLRVPLLAQLMSGLTNNTSIPPWDNAETIDKLLRLPNEWPNPGPLLVQICHDEQCTAKDEKLRAEHDCPMMDTNGGDVSSAEAPLATLRVPSAPSIKAWFPGHLTKGSPGLDLTPYIRQGHNKIQLIQMEDFSDRVFVLVAHNKPLSAFQPGKSQLSTLPQKASKRPQPQLATPSPTAVVDTMDVDDARDGQEPSATAQASDRNKHASSGDKGEDNNVTDTGTPQALRIALEKLNFNDSWGGDVFPINPTIWETFGGSWQDNEDKPAEGIMTNGRHLPSSTHETI